MTQRYFYAGNSTRPIRVGELGKYQISFEQTYQEVGAWRGLYATDNAEIADLLAARGGSVREIDKKEYDSESEKKRLLNPLFRVWGQKNPEQLQQQSVEVAEGAEASEAPTDDGDLEIVGNIDVPPPAEQIDSPPPPDKKKVAKKKIARKSSKKNPAKSTAT